MDGNLLALTLMFRELNWISNWLNFKNPEFGDSSLQTDLFNPEAICNKGLGFKVNLILLKSNLQ